MTSRLITVSAVRSVLNNSTSPHVATFTALLDNGKNHPLKCQQPAKDRFGPTLDDFPHLTSKNKSNVPSERELRDILLKDLQEVGARPVFFPAPRSKYGENIQSAEAVAVELINNITDPDYSTDGMTLNLPCPTLDKMWENEKEIPDDALYITSTVCSVMPSNTPVALQHHNETTSLNMLLTGSITWIIWPPTDRNLSVLQTAYEAFAEDFNHAKFDVAHDLEGGVTCVQSVGEGLRIPPYCILLGLAMKTSVLASSSICSAGNFVTMLRKIPLLKASWNTEVGGEQERVEYGNAIRDCIAEILSGVFDTDLNPRKVSAKDEGALPTLLQAWDEVKNNVVSVLDSETAKELKEIWNEFLVGVAGRHCAMCGKRLQVKLKEMGKHFDDTHWPEQQDEGERVDSMGPEQVGDTSGEESGEDSMEVDE